MKKGLAVSLSRPEEIYYHTEHRQPSCLEASRGSYFDGDENAVVLLTTVEGLPAVEEKDQIAFAMKLLATVEGVASGGGERVKARSFMDEVYGWRREHHQHVGDYRRVASSGGE